MVNVKITKEKLLDMLLERVEFWTKNEEVYRLYEEMYSSYIYGGCFDGMELDIMVIVDNDYINYCYIVDEADENYNKLMAIYNECGYCDVSCEDVGYSYIEAEYNGLLLCRI